MSDQKQSEQFMALQASYNGISPKIAAPLSRAHPGAVVLGRATIGARAQLGAFSVIRADGHTVDIGDDFFLGPRATVHIAHDIYPTRIGQNVTAGAGAVVHACDVGDDCVIGDGAVILDGSSLAAGVVLDANAVVFPRSTLEAGKRYAGAPAKPVGTVTQTERDAIRAQVRHDAELAEMTVPAQPQTLDCFVAPSARLNGEIKVGEGVGIWYGCVLNANAHTISIGQGTNVQDNSVLICDDGDIVIGPDVTIGHNVTLGSCAIARDTLIGMGARLANGTEVEPDILVAAGAQTTPGQRLTSGHVWAGFPAKPIAEMNAGKRQVLTETLPMYRGYAEVFRAAKHLPLS